MFSTRDFYVRDGVVYRITLTKTGQIVVFSYLTPQRTGVLFYIRCI